MKCVYLTRVTNFNPSSFWWCCSFPNYDRPASFHVNNFHWNIGSLIGLLQSEKLVSLTFLRSERLNLGNLRFSGPLISSCRKCYCGKWLWFVFWSPLPVVFIRFFSRDNRPRTKIQWFILKSYRGVFEAFDNILMVYKFQLIISHSSKFGLINFIIC